MALADADRERIRAEVAAMAGPTAEEIALLRRVLGGALLDHQTTDADPAPAAA